MTPNFSSHTAALKAKCSSYQNAKRERNAGSNIIRTLQLNTGCHHKGAGEVSLFPDQLHLRQYYWPSKAALIFVTSNYVKF